MPITGYAMTAEENYTSGLAAEIDGAGFTNFIGTDQAFTGVNYDAVRRKLTWAGQIWQTFTRNITNSTGHTLWDGRASIAPGGTIDQRSRHCLYLFEKDLDTGVVTAYYTWDAANLVPAGVSTGDGTWRRFVSDVDRQYNYPILCDPRTGNKWLHLQSCELYLFRLEDDFAQIISPLAPTLDINDAVIPLGMNEDWVFALEQGTGVSDGGPYPFFVTPRLITATETTDDILLIYATYDAPINARDAVENFYRTCVDPDGNLWLFNNPGGSALTAPDYTLWKFTPPTLGAFPATGGGWVEKTPWTSTTGPNGGLSGYTVFTADTYDRNIVMALRETPHLVILSANTPDGADSVDLTYRLDCTYFNTSTDAFVTHQGIVTGYMTSAWAPTDDPDAAAYFIDTSAPTSQLNEYLNQHDYDFGVDYRDRWLWFRVFPVVAGVTGSDSRLVMVQYRFAPTSAPTIRKFIDEATSFDPLYTAYATALGVDAVVNGSISTGLAPYFQGRDKGLFDETTNAFWWSGQTDIDEPNSTVFWDFDADFTARADAQSDADGWAAPPFLKLAFTETALKRVIVQSLILNLPELPDVLDEEGDSVPEEGDGEGEDPGDDSGGGDTGGGDVGGDEDLGELTPVVFDRPGFTTFYNIGGWDQSIAQFTANAALMTHVTLDNPDWIEGYDTRLSVLNAIHALSLKAATGAGRRYDTPSTGSDLKSYLPAEVINHAAVLNGGLLQLPDESDLYWNGGAGNPAYSPPATLQIVTDWKAGNGGTLSGVPVYHNTLSRPQLFGSYSVNAPYLDDPNLFATSADQYPLSYDPNQSILIGGHFGATGILDEFTTGATGMVTWANKFGPHPAGATGQLGKPHFEALSMCRQTAAGRHLTAAEQDVLAWSIVIMGGDGWTQFTTAFDLPGSDPQGNGRDKWSPSSAGLPGGMKVWMAAAIARYQLIESKGCLFRDVGHGGGRSWFRIRRSAPATAPFTGSDLGPINGEALTWASPASVHFLPGGWQAIRMWNEAKTQSWFLLQNIVAFGSARTLALDPTDPWYTALNGKTHDAGEVVFYNSDGTVVSGWV